MKAEGLRHDTEEIVRCRNLLLQAVQHPDCPENIRAPITVVLDTLTDLSKKILASKGLDKELVGKIIDGLLR